MAGQRHSKRRKPSAWSSSAQFRAIGSAAIRAWNAQRPNNPKCGAIARSTGEPCKQLAKENGRCYFHGGRTPKGNNWHKTRWPDPGAPDAELKLQRKLKQQERAARQKEARLAAMSPEERERHEIWQRQRPPGSAASRMRKARERSQAAEARQLLEQASVGPQDPQHDLLSEQIRQLEAELESLRRPPHDIFG